VARKKARWPVALDQVESNRARFGMTDVRGAFVIHDDGTVERLGDPKRWDDPQDAEMIRRSFEEAEPYTTEARPKTKTARRARGARRPTKADREAAVQEVRLRLGPWKREFLLGDRTGVQNDALAAIDELDRVREQIPDWAYDLLVGLALRAAAEYKRDGRRSFKERDRLLAQTDDWLETERGFRSASERARIMHEALVSLKRHTLSAGAIEKNVRSIRLARGK
jgi:hypothetical protein